MLTLPPSCGLWLLRFSAATFQRWASATSNTAAFSVRRLTGENAGVPPARALTG